MGRKILVVDDEVVLVETIAYNLEQAGYKVVTAFDSTEALRLVDSFCPHLLTIELLLPQQSRVTNLVTLLQVRQ